MKKHVVISSPYRAVSDDPLQRAQEKQRNILMARAACRLALRRDYVPIAPHLYFPQFLRDDEPAERRVGIETALRCIGYCDELWAIGDRISEGMADEIAYANEIGIPIRCIPDFASGEEELLAVVKGDGKDSKL